MGGREGVRDVIGWDVGSVQGGGHVIGWDVGGGQGGDRGRSCSVSWQGGMEVCMMG